jgi:hypothetical protein
VPEAPALLPEAPALLPQAPAVLPEAPALLPQAPAQVAALPSMSSGDLDAWLNQQIFGDEAPADQLGEADLLGEADQLGETDLLGEADQLGEADLLGGDGPLPALSLEFSKDMGLLEPAAGAHTLLHCAVTCASLVLLNGCGHC